MNSDTENSNTTSSLQAPQQLVSPQTIPPFTNEISKFMYSTPMPSAEGTAPITTKPINSTNTKSPGPNQGYTNPVEQSNESIKTSISTFIERAFETTEKGVKDLGREIDKSLKKTIHGTRYSDHFNSIFQLPEEKVIGEFLCKALTKDAIFKGNLLITPNYICFFCDRRDAIVKVVVPISKILLIQKAVAKESENPKLEPLPKVSPFNPANEEKFNLIQIFTSDRLVHQFYDIFDLSVVLNLVEYVISMSRFYPPVQKH